MDQSWKAVNSRAALLFFIVAFLTFMSISGFPAFQEDMQVGALGALGAGCAVLLRRACMRPSAGPPPPSCPLPPPPLPAARVPGSLPTPTAPPPQVFLRERLSGYYGVSNFVAANSLASAPFIMGIAVISSAIVYWLAGLNDSGGWRAGLRAVPLRCRCPPAPTPPPLPLPPLSAGDRFVYFFLNLFMALATVEGLMMAIAAIVPHYLMGIAGGAGLMGMYMLVCGFFQTVDQLPKPVWRYPLPGRCGEAGCCAETGRLSGAGRRGQGGLLG
jgi:hypothetical protein